MVSLEEPDTGRAWVVAFAACIINMILSGISRMIGILYVAVIDTYGVTRAEATLPFTVRNSIRSLSGPLVGILGQRFGIKKVTLFGGIVAAAGAGFCSFAPNVFWLDVFWGGIHGLGFAFANTLIQVVVGQYFEKYKVTASGIALSGACVGSLGFPILVEWILDTYGLSGGFLILAGIVMNVLPPALLLSSPQWVNYPEAYARAKLRQRKTSSIVETPVEEPDDILAHELGDWIFERDQRIDAKEVVRSMSLSDCPIETMSICSSYKSNGPKNRKSVFVYDHWEIVDDKKKMDNSVTCTLYQVHDSPVTERKGEFENEETTESSTKSAIDVYTISDKVQNIKKNHMEVQKSTNNKYNKNPNQQSFSESFKCIVKLYTKNPVYVLLNVCMSTYIIIFIPILTVLVDYGKDKGMSDSDGKYLINALAVGDLVGRLGFGWVTERNLMTISNFMCVVLALQGVFIAVFPFSSSLMVLSTLLILYGMTAGSILVLFPVLVFKYVDAHEQSVALSCVGFLSGLVSFGIAPMIGHFRDEVGSYDGMFYLTGFLSLISGLMWLMEPVVARRYYKNDSDISSKKVETKENGIMNNSKDIVKK
ncbi:hypothetical protein JTE90_022262 [Oedothorax gibbosus]|uniref:Uncharacterized protein n=1 Tax=Oedothorax gibbosus TaxID=931172 RepID=A0AAV6VVI8_9ARAC|nr:hypothetical protein JTE90_022262 [Oedothorax gibbosus]